MKKVPYFMIFYEDLALLHQTANKKTRFLMEMFLRMDKRQYVQMTQFVRLEIMADISPATDDKLGLARQYLKRLVKEGMITNCGKGAYMINPRIAGFNNVAHFINEKAEKFIKLKYKNGKRIISVGNCETE